MVQEHIFSDEVTGSAYMKRDSLSRAVVGGAVLLCPLGKPQDIMQPVLIVSQSLSHQLVPCW